MQIVDITDKHGNIIALELLARAESVHRELRPQLPADYMARIQVVFAGGARMCVALDGDEVVGIALWRLIENTYEGKRLYVDDLVTHAPARSKGVGKQLLIYLEQQARLLNCDVLALDSGVQRAAAHKFYFREGMQVSSFSFRKILE